MELFTHIRFTLAIIVFYIFCMTKATHHPPSHSYRILFYLHYLPTQHFLLPVLFNSAFFEIYYTCSSPYRKKGSDPLGPAAAFRVLTIYPA